MDVSLVELASIKPYERNPRLTDAVVDPVARSLQEFGFWQPIVVDSDGVIVCGHTRWKAAAKLGLARVPVHVARDMSPEQLRAYRIADNQTAAIAEWDFGLLVFDEEKDGGTYPNHNHSWPSRRRISSASSPRQVPNGVTASKGGENRPPA